MSDPKEVKNVTVTNQLDVPADFIIAVNPPTFRLEPGAVQEISLTLSCNRPNKLLLNEVRRKNVKE